MLLESHTLDNDSDISNGFNKYFYSIFTQSSFKPSHPETSTDGLTISSISFTLEEVSQQLFKLDTSKAPGVDGISTKVLQCCAGSLTLLFTIYLIYALIRALFQMSGTLTS